MDKHVLYTYKEKSAKLYVEENDSKVFEASISVICVERI